MRSVRSATWTSVDPLSVSWVRYFATVGALSNAILEFALRALLCRGTDTGSLNRCKPWNLADLGAPVKASQWPAVGQSGAGGFRIEDFAASGLTTIDDRRLSED